MADEEVIVIERKPLARRVIRWLQSRVLLEKKISPRAMALRRG